MISIVIGLPRSGKSTFCEKLRAENPQLVIVCADIIRLQLYRQRFCQVGEQMVFAVKDVMVRSLLATNHQLLIDETHTTQKSLEDILRLDPYVKSYFIDTHPDICKQRALDCSQYDLINCGVIEHMATNLRKLDPSIKERFKIKAEWI